jgi:hypothetical protein
MILLEDEPKIILEYDIIPTKNSMAATERMTMTRLCNDGVVGGRVREEDFIDTMMNQDV